jgi:hypothetical protein
MGAIIEARSCERFAALAPFLDHVLQKFYCHCCNLNPVISWIILRWPNPAHRQTLMTG